MQQGNDPRTAKQRKRDEQFARKHSTKPQAPEIVPAKSPLSRVMEPVAHEMAEEMNRLFVKQAKAHNDMIHIDLKVTEQEGLDMLTWLKKYRSKRDAKPPVDERGNAG